LPEPFDLLLQFVNFAKEIQHEANADPIDPEILAQTEDATEAEDRGHIKKRFRRRFYRIKQAESHQPLCQRRMDTGQACDFT
jgi:hypothetical protein